MKRIVRVLQTNANTPAPPVLDTTKKTEPLVDRIGEHPTIQEPSKATAVVATAANQISKSEAIRAMSLKNPAARNCEIIAKLKEEGIVVSRQLVKGVRNPTPEKGERLPPVLKLPWGEKKTAIRAAILADKTAGRTEIVKQLRSRGIRVSEEYIRLVRIELKAEGHVFPVYSKGGKKLPVITNAIKAAIIETPAATNEEIAGELAGRNIKTTKNTVADTRSKMRKEGTYIDIPAKPKPYPELNVEQQKLLKDSITYAESYAKHRWHGHLRGIGSPDDFADFVLGRLPFIVAAYESFRPQKERRSWKNFLKVGAMFCEKMYRAQVLSIALDVPQYKINLLMGILGDLNRGMSLEQSAEKRKITVERAQELIDQYNEYRRVTGTTTLDSVRENRNEFRTGAYSGSSTEDSEVD
ncbi:MAG: hypothetical protein WCT31_05865 [Candidatus Micrarchaeia archaeon]